MAALRAAPPRPGKPAPRTLPRARTLARVPLEEQVRRWREAQERDRDKDPTGRPGDRRPSPSRAITAALTKFDTEPTLLATALRDQLGESGVATLLALLADGETHA